jgi:hypothetical protein
VENIRKRTSFVKSVLRPKIVRLVVKVDPAIRKKRSSFAGQAVKACAVVKQSFYRSYFKSSIHSENTALDITWPLVAFFGNLRLF